MNEMRTTQRSSSTAALLLIAVTMSAAAQAAEPPTASVSSPPAIAAPAAPSQPAPVEANATQSPAPMAAPNPDKARIDLTGFVAAQITFDTNDAVRQNHLISVDGQGRDGRFGWAFDATRLNLAGQLGAGGFTLQGRAEADMQSSIFFRIRHAYAAVSKRGTTLLLGQTDTLIGNQVGPNNFNNDWMFAQGNAYDRLPQLRVSHDTGRFFFAAAVLPNVHGATDVIPHAQARILVRFAQGRGLFGAAGHFGYSNHVRNPADATREVDGVLSYLASVDSGVTMGPVALSAQAWFGAGAAHGTGGHAIGNPLFVVNASGDPVSVPAAGGFLDVFIKPSARLAIGAAGGASVIIDAAPGGVQVPISSNATTVLYASFALRPNWVFALEAQGARTVRAIDAAAPDVYTPLYDGRLLFGQRYSF